MKALFFFIIILLSIDMKEYLGRSINDFPNAIRLNEETDSNINSYGLEGSFEFYNRSFSFLNFETDINDTIIGVGFVLDDKIDKILFNKLSESFGKPNTMLKFGDMVNQQAINHIDYRSLMTKSLAVKCSFEENPAIIIWELEQMKVVVQKHPDNNHTLIKYTTKDN